MRSIGSRRSFVLFTCIPNQPLIPKINLLKGSVTPRIFCATTRRSKRERGMNGFLWDYGISSAFFPTHAPVSPMFASTGFPQTFHGSVTLCVFKNVFQIPGPSRLYLRDLPLGEFHREVEPVVCSRTYCASNDPVYGVISRSSRDRLLVSRLKSFASTLRTSADRESRYCASILEYLKFLA